MSDQRCLICGSPADKKSPTGHWSCQRCRDDTEPFQVVESWPDPVDLHTLMSSEPRKGVFWCVEPLLPVGKLTGIVSKRGEGKSLLLLNVAVNLATGHAVLEQPAGEPVDVVYLDQEMGRNDLYDRLADLGWLPDAPEFDLLCEHLHYYQLVDIPFLDTEEGGVALEQIVALHKAELVIIDTVSRVVLGDENTSEPYRALFRHTETRLKRHGVTVARLDHFGKNPSKGSRGHSAKEDSLDVVWEMKVSGSDITLNLSKGRPAGLHTTVHIKRETINGHLSHTISPQSVEQWVVDHAYLLDELGMEPDSGVNQTQKALKEIGRGIARAKIRDIVAFRKEQAQSGSEPPRTT